MVNQTIIDYLNNQKNKGYTQEELRNMSIRRGYDSKEVDEALDQLSSPKESPKQQEADYPEPKPVKEEPKEEPQEETKPELVKEELSYPEPENIDDYTFEKHYNEPEKEHNGVKKPKSIGKIILIISIIILILGGVGFAILYIPSCGNGAIERWETSETCCSDIGCPGQQSCQNNICIELTCGTCQYIDNNVCKDYECCNNSDCNEISECKENKCIEIQCNECEYLENLTCIRYECCNSTQCPGGEFCVDNKCTAFSCGDCQYLKNGTCFDYDCCQDSDCDDDLLTTIDACLNPKTKEAECLNNLGTLCQRDGDCDDNNASTQDICLATSGFCASALITTCEHDDGFCPKYCSYEEDHDCTDDIEDCESDIDCIIDNIDDECNPSKIYYEYIQEVDRRIMGYESNYEVRGMDDNKCTFYTYYTDVTLEFNNNLTQELLNNGTSQQAIYEMEDAEEDDFEDDYQRKDKTCYYPEDKLLDLWDDIKDEKIIDFSYEEDDYDCTGSLYD